MFRVAQSLLIILQEPTIKKNYVVNDNQLQQVIYHSTAATQWKNVVLHISDTL